MEVGQETSGQSSGGIKREGYTTAAKGITFETSVSMVQMTCHGSSKGTACLQISLRVIPILRHWTAWSSGTGTRCWNRQLFPYSNHGCWPHRETVTATSTAVLELVSSAKLDMQFRLFAFVTSAQRKPGGDHAFGRVSSAAANLAHYWLDLGCYFLCTFMTVCSRSFCGCGESQFLNFCFILLLTADCF